MGKQSRLFDKLEGRAELDAAPYGLRRTVAEALLREPSEDLLAKYEFDSMEELDEYHTVLVELPGNFNHRDRRH